MAACPKSATVIAEEVVLRWNKLNECGTTVIEPALHMEVIPKEDSVSDLHLLLVMGPG